MKNLLIAFSLLALAACGSKDKSKTDPVVGVDQSPQVSIPANAALTDFNCEKTVTFNLKDFSGLVERSARAGVNYDWMDADMFVTYSQDSSGLAKVLDRKRIQELGNQQRRDITETTHWLSVNSIWSKSISNIEELTVLENGNRRLLSHKVNGVESTPAWMTETQVINYRLTKTVSRHLNPASLNDGTRIYTNVEEVCLYTRR
ncbi:MAG: hypothetical protein ACXWQO_00180 [Bdellovibrionota bacterium]